MSVPNVIRDEAFDLEGRDHAFLYTIVLSNNVVIRLSPKQTFTWRGNVFDEIPCHMSQMSRTADGKMSRPKFTVANPQGLFTSTVNSGILENALITRHRIRMIDLLNDQPVSLDETRRVSRIASVTREMIVLELRGALDGANFTLPYRSFNPLQFPNVKLQ